ncbi:dol-P-Glc:Glc(2)Man(9)GlcNAc(2)-PP-Dol alpha-1,2-glucosyltransferase isoform X2 [Scleropages formosus]|uniref:dol-P-Glc:Glc(2)Man(9)GlcNAc(2)-PP-Dol alpha-1,2-glucosyltransferase isoform X2 n=1 Tax=Scleropages formosus TaxID=113540 RepID=UPI0008789334|nr:putative Dol-P-Glc:Glc(2)Man(9)GlcNAc(2)-PP-Dol alpha-1,2-glucosyltransferase isoform X2 [Scleropages formosus]
MLALRETMERAEGYAFTALCSTNFLVACLLFATWDPMITTLPGLYLLSVGLIKPLVLAVGWTGRAVCSTAMLRFVNLLFNCGNLYVLSLIVGRLHPKDKTRSASRRVLSALALSTFPVLYFFTFLYYTDAGSTFFSLFAYLMSLYGSHKIAALLGACAILFRQTNIIWVAFCAGSVVASKMDEAWRTERSKKKDEKSLSQVSLSVSGAGKVLRFSVDYLMTPCNTKAVLLVIWPYVAVAVGFLGFVVVNGGIVVGDRTSHEACLNFPQLFYFLAFTLIFSAPVSVSYGRIVSFLHSVRKKPFRYLFVTFTCLLLVWKFTFVHKYLLADNRHYPFYVWKKIFQRHELVPYLLVPGYVFAAWNFAETLKWKSLFWNLAFLVCLTAATVPQKLIEFRYFIMPYLMYRLHVPLPSVFRLLLELGFYTAVNAATLYIFINRTFQWPNSSDVQRFMW